MSDKRLKDFLPQMKQTAQETRDSVSDMQYEEFLADLRTQRAVVMSMLIVGETAGRILERFPEFTQKHGEIPWHFIRGIRNRMAHGYFDLQWQIVWDTVQGDLPALIGHLDRLEQDA